MDRKMVLGQKEVRGVIYNPSQEELRQLQLIEIEMLVEFDRICRKYDIKYSLDGGTLLGAVRHKGFIPWDDDIDVTMTRHEYAKFYKACKKDLDKERFFLQEYRTDSQYRWGWAKIRRKGTDYIRVNQEHMKYKRGVFLDIIVVDNVPDNVVLREIHRGICFIIRKILYSEVGMYMGNNLLRKMMYKALHVIPKEIVFRVRNVVGAACNRHKTKLKRDMSNPYRTKYGVPAECYDAYTEIEFEGMKFMAFADYDKYLKVKYDDYMTIPPVEKRKGTVAASYMELIEITLDDIKKKYEEGMQSLDDVSFR